MVNTRSTEQLEELQRRHKIVWECLKAPLQKHGLPWADSKLLGPIRNPVRISADPLNKVIVEINTETLAENPNVAWNAMCDMEEALKEEYGYVESQTLYGFRYITFNFKEKVE